MKQPQAPCLHCEVRKPACQRACALYGKYIEQYSKYKALVDRARHRERVIDDFKYERIISLRRWTER